MGLRNWTDTLFGDIQDFHQDELLHSDNQISVYASVLSTIISRVMTEKVEQDLLLITDLKPGHIFMKRFQQQMFDLNYHIDVQLLSPADIHNIDNAVLETMTH